MRLILPDPVNLAYPINQGLESWWMVLPERVLGGGLTFRDLMGRNHGTLSGGMGVANWVDGNRPGGWGSLDFDGGNIGHVAVDSTINRINPRPISIIAWCRTNTISESVQSVYSNNDSNNPALYVDFVKVAGTTYRQRLFSTASYNNGADTFTLDTEWHSYGWCWDDSDNISYFRDGQSAGTGSRALGVFNAAGASIGSLAASASGNLRFDGQIDDLRIYNRILSARDYAALYDESRAGYPNALRWAERSRGKAPAVSNTHPYYFRNNVIRRRAA